MRLSKRIISIALTLLMLIGTVTALPLGVSAKTADLAQIGGYDTSYTLTGNGATDIVAVAKKQLWKDGYNLGYGWILEKGYGWCDRFVIECASLAGQSAAIPNSPGCSNLYTAVLNAGGYTVSTPQAGDLVFYTCTSSGYMSHVAIMTDSVNSVQGSVDNKVQPLNIWSYRCWVNNQATQCYTVTYIRPNYQGGGTPVQPANPMPGASTLTVNAGTSSTNTTFSWTATENTDHYELWVKNQSDGSTVVYQGGLTATQYQLQLPEGNYVSYIASIDNDRYEANSSPWWTYSNEVSFSVTYDPFQDSLPVNLGSDFYATIVKSDTGTPLHSSNNNVQLADPNNLNDYSHIWHFVMKNDASYMIINCEDSKPLTVANKGTTDATNVETYMNLDYDSQRWYIYKNSENQYVLKPKHCDLVLDVEWNNNAYGTNVHIYTYNGAEAQLFDIQYQP